jgi:uncharacterized protein YegP (UPF0339 family)
MMARDDWRGVRRARVTLELSGRSASVKDVTILESPAVQRRTLSGTHLVQVIVNGTTRLLVPFDDPFLIRGVSRPEQRGHSYERRPTTTIHVDVPIESDVPIGDAEIRILDISKVRGRPIDAPVLAERLESRKSLGRLVAKVTNAALAAHPAWAAIAAVPVTTIGADGVFEIYLDRAKKYRWRLRRPDGEIVADGGQGYAERAACEADLRWIRQHGYKAPVRPLDMS